MTHMSQDNNLLKDYNSLVILSRVELIYPTHT